MRNSLVAKRTLKINKFLLEDMIIAPMHALRLIPEEAVITDYDLDMNVDKDNMVTFTYEVDEDEPENNGDPIYVDFDDDEVDVPKTAH